MGRPESSWSSGWQAAITALVVGGCLLAVGLPALHSARASLLASTQSEVLQLARAAAALVDVEALREVRSPADAGSAAQLRVLTPLVRLHRAVQDIMYLYIAVLRDGDIYFQTGTDALYRVPEDDLPPDPIMSRYPGSDPQLREALTRRVETVNPAPVREMRRSYLSAYVPLRDATGGFHGVLGMDMWAHHLDARQAQLDRAAWLSAALIAALMAAAAVLRFRQHQAGVRALRSANRWRTITDHVPVQISYIDRDERYRFCNGAFREQFGIEPEHMVGRTVREIRGEHLYAQIQASIRSALDGTRSRVTTVSDHLPPAHFHTEYIPDVNQGEVHGVYAMTVDCTAIRDAELKLASAERTAALHQLLGQLAASFSNQLSVVHGYLESIDTDSVTQGDLDITRLSLEDSLRLVEQLQLLAGYSTAQFDIVPIAALAEELAEQWRREAHHVDLRVDVPFDLPMVLGSTTLLRTALIEILENAREASGSTAGAIELRAVCVAAPLQPRGLVLVDSVLAARVLLITIQDHGQGMEEAVLRRAADPFFTTRAGHKGLGLSLVAGIVRAHGGQLWVHSEIGRGTAVMLAMAVSA